MSAAPLPPNEAARLAVLRSHQILDTPPEAAFDRITHLAAQALEMPITAVSFIDRDRQWFKSIVGLDVCETSRDLSFCAHAILQDDVLVVPDATADPRFADNALVTGEPGIRFYAGAPLYSSQGQPLGALCVIDRQPRTLDQRQRDILRNLAALVVDEMALRREITARRQAETALLDQHRVLKEANDSVERRVKARTAELTALNETLQSEIRQRQLADQERDRSEHRFRQLFNQASEAAFVHDVDGWLVDLNVAACTLLGYSREELLQMNVRDFTLDHVPADGVPFWRELAVGSTAKFECRDRRKDGSTLLVEAHGTVLDTPQGRHLLVLVRDITELRRNEDALRAMETRYQRIAAHTPGVVYQHLSRPDGSVVIPFMSEGSRVLYGLEPHEIQRNPQLMIDCVHPEDRAGFVAAIRTAKSHLTPMHWQGRHLLPGGEVRWMRVDSRPERLPDGGVICDGIVIDITDQKKRKLALRQSEERFRLAIVHSPFPVMLHADDGEVLQVNDAWTHLTGYVADELATIEDWIQRAYPTQEGQEGIRRHLAGLVNRIGAVENSGQHIRCADGDERIWDFTCANLDRLPDGRWLHITTAVDVTERHQGEEALRAAKEEAERANRAKSAFLSRMSHELRTPLNAILGFGQLLEMSTLEPQDATSLGYILKGGRHLLGLIDEVLDLSRAETGDLHLVLGHVKLEMLARECVGLVTRLALARGITCQVKVSRKATLWGDEQRLRQMLLNLLSNAIKYNHAGGKVIVRSQKMPSGRLRLKVTDTGPGISKEGLRRLFVPFERLEQEFGEVEGTGLGLVVSRRIAEAMGGALGVQSEVGRGSTFWIELPQAPRPAAEPSEAMAPAELSPACALLPTPNARLLYIEDNLSNLQVVKTLLANCRPRWQFLSARNGEEGLAQAHEGLPDLILLDLQLPGMKGDAVLAELRRDPLTRHIPVVLLSADATAPSRERLLAGGADDYISKPFKLESLLELLDRTLLKAAVNQQNESLSAIVRLP